MKVVGTNALETGDGLLGRADGGELRDQVILASLLERLKMGGTGMGQMVEIVRIRDETFQLVT